MHYEALRSSFTISSSRVVCHDGIKPAAVHVRDGVIVAVVSRKASSAGLDVLDVGDRVVMPGLVDSHVHVNEPGRTDWEGFVHATRGAAVGGYTTLVDMPLNCLPATTTVEGLQLKVEAARNSCHVDYGFWGGIVPGNCDQLQPLAEGGVLGFKCFLSPPGVSGFEMVSVDDLERAMPIVARLGLPVLAHCEWPPILDRARTALEADPSADWRSFLTYVASRPPDAEAEAIRVMIRLSHKHACRVHIVHLACLDALPDLRSGRRVAPVSVETCPHYLTFCAEEIPDRATVFKCAPPIRSRDTREGLWKALVDGDIDLIATDHSPCPPAMKDGDGGSFLRAWGGIASLQVALSAVWTEAERRGIGLVDVVRWMAARPAELTGLRGRKGAIAEGHDADLVVFDPEAHVRCEPAGWVHRHPLTPYMSMALRGRVEATFVRGRLVASQGRVSLDRPYGERCLPPAPGERLA